MNIPELQQLTQAVKDRGTPFRVLVVDDEQWVREVFHDFCKVTDAFDVELAQDGKEALKKVRDQKFDLITLDLIMPEMSGLEVLNSIREISPHVPVMIITGNATDKLVTEAGVGGASRVLYKPVMLENFVAELTSALIK